MERSLYGTSQDYQGLICGLKEIVKILSNFETVNTEVFSLVVIIKHASDFFFPHLHIHINIWSYSFHLLIAYHQANTY